MAMPSSSSAFTGIIIGLVSSFGSIILISLIIFIIWISGCVGSGRILLDRLGRPGEYDDEQAFAREEAEALENMDDMAKTEYLRAKGMWDRFYLEVTWPVCGLVTQVTHTRTQRAPCLGPILFRPIGLTDIDLHVAFITHNPPESAQTDISLSQYLAIQEKGVSAWEFEPELEIANCFVEGRTEIEFFDSECTVLTNLPVPKQNDVYYWEAKVYEKAESTLLSIGMATKPYPLFRLPGSYLRHHGHYSLPLYCTVYDQLSNSRPGFHKYSVAYQSTGHRRYNQPFSKTSYGPQFVQGDVIGVGYRPRTGAIFYTRNGKKLEEVVHGLKAQNFFPAIGANGPATVHVNFGQAGFVFIEANVKKWGLAPVTGSLAPPPPYGSEQGSILLETGNKDGFVGGPQSRSHSQSFGGSPYHVRHGEHLNPHQQHTRSRSGNFRILPPTSPGPVRSPTDISLAHLVPNEDNGEGSSHIVSRDEHDSNPLHLHIEDATNPPPGYASPPLPSGEHQRRDSTDSEDNTPLISVVNRNRGDSAVTVVPAATFQAQQAQAHPPVPSYSDAVRQGAGRQSASRQTRSRSPSPYSDDSDYSY